MVHSVDDLWFIAHQVRTEFETGLITNEEILDAYGTQFSRGTREAMAAEMYAYRPRFPDQNCEYASVVIGARLGYGELWPGSYALMPHKVWNVGATVLDKTTIMDITADQFGGPAIYVGPPKWPWELNATEF